jgi:hypothetical protein
MKQAIYSLAALALFACRPEPAQEEVVETGNFAEQVRPQLPDADINASLESIVGDGNGADPAAPRFVGLWAADQRLCARTAWRFSEEELSTPAGAVCRFTDVRAVPGGYDIAARCTAEAPERDDRLRLRFPESARGMLFESDSIADAGLVRCED